MGGAPLIGMLGVGLQGVMGIDMGGKCVGAWTEGVGGGCWLFAFVSISSSGSLVSLWFE